MDLRAFKYTIEFVFLFTFWGNNYVFAAPHKIDNPLVPYEVKFADITFQLNDVTRYLIQNELKNIQSNKQNIQNQLDKVALFLPVVEPILKEQNVPDDFKYLVSYNKYQSSIENNINLEAGVFWCLDKQKAEDVDLLMNNQLDERKHLIAATKGAAMCLRRNYVLYSNWGTTLFSHISDKKVLSLLEVSKKWSGNTYILLDSPAYMSILQFLAYKLAIEKEFPLYKPAVPKVVYEYPYSKGKTLNKISAELKVEPATLSEYNLWLISKNVPDTDCQVLVVVPTSRFNEVRTLAELSRKVGLPSKDLGFPVLKREELVEKSKGVNKGGIFYKINDLKGLQAEMCDAVVNMAYKAGISIEKFVEYNDMKVNDLLHIGQVYYIEKKNVKASVPFHVVREGETLWDISQIYGVKLENLLEYNRFDSVQRLQRGRIIWMQTTRPKNKPIEYIEMPDEFAAIEELIATENDSESLVPIPVKDTVNVKENQALLVKNNNNILDESVPKEIDLNSLPLSKEIRKEQPKNINLPKDVDSKGVQQNNLNGKKQDLKYESAPNNKTITESGVSKEENNSSIKYVSHTVRKDETLFRISINYNVSVEQLWKLNNLSSTIIEVGTVLKVKRL